MEFTAQSIAEFLKGKVVGDPNVKVSSVAKIEEGVEGTLSFLANPKYNEFAYKTKASILIVNEDFIPARDISATLIKVKDAYKALAMLLQLQESMKPKKTGIHPQSVIEASSSYGKELYLGAHAYVGENCTIGNQVKIFPQVYIGDNVEIGDNCIFYPGVKIYQDCKIGSNCIIHAGAIIGSDGFGFAPDTGNDYNKIPQVGNVILENNVEIGANTTIDRATLGSTVLGKGVKLDNLIQIAHNVEIGANTVIAAQSGIAGSTKVGKDCMFGGQVGITGHVSIANGVKAAAQTGIGSSVKEENIILLGSPAFRITDFNRSYVYFKKLPELVKRLDKLEKKVDDQ